MCAARFPQHVPVLSGKPIYFYLFTFCYDLGRCSDCLARLQPELESSPTVPLQPLSDLVRCAAADPLQKRQALRGAQSWLKSTKPTRIARSGCVFIIAGQTIAVLICFWFYSTTWWSLIIIFKEEDTFFWRHINHSKQISDLYLLLHWVVHPPWQTNPLKDKRELTFLTTYLAICLQPSAKKQKKHSVLAACWRTQVLSQALKRTKTR